MNDCQPYVYDANTGNIVLIQYRTQMTNWFIEIMVVFTKQIHHCDKL